MRYITLLILISGILVGFDYPRVTDSGEVFYTTHTGRGLYHFDGKTSQLIGDEGYRGRNISLDGDRLAFKIINPDGSQVPVILEGNTLKELTRPVPSTGIPVFHGKDIFIPQGDQLLIQTDDRKLTLDNSLQDIAISEDGIIAYVNDKSELRLMEPATGFTRTLLTNVFHPSFSSNGQYLAAERYGELYPCVVIVNLRASSFEKAIIELQYATSPTWADDVLIFQRTDEYNYEVASSELHQYDPAADREIRLTSTPSIHESRPSASPNGDYIAFTCMKTGSIYRAAFDPVAGLGNIIKIPKPDIEGSSDPILRPMEAEDVYAPYLHQVYDTPNDFNGHWSCGPSSCLMAVQKYDMLPDHTITCSSPYSHTHDFGWYVPNIYTYNGYTYDIEGLAAGDVWVPGAHGFICRSYGGAVWAHMVTFMDQHLVDSWQTGTAWSTYQGQIDASYCMYASTSVMGYGHIQCFVGYFGDHGIVSNDPYGNANYSPWCQYNGEGALYDWPGYDNGYLEISISQLFTAHGEGGGPEATEPDTLVDDYGYGFERHGPAEYWHSWYGGFWGHVYWTYSADASSDENYAYWLPNLPWLGIYEVFVHVPSNYATSQARFKVWHNLGEDVTVVDQTAYYDDWVSIGTYGFDNVIGGYVYLGDATGTDGNYLGCDAVKWHYISPLAPSDSIIDDGQDGFDRTATSRFYHHTYSGWGEHSLFTFTTNSADTCYVVWRADLTYTDLYEILVYIPPENADATGAKYRVTHSEGSDLVIVNQSAHRGSWVSLGDFYCNAGTEANVYLGDATGTSGQKIAFDAVKFRRLFATDIEEERPENLSIKAYPNPFNSSLAIEAEKGMKVTIYDVLGNEVFSKEMTSTGSLRWIPSSALSSGAYRIVWESDEITDGMTVYLLK